MASPTERLTKSKDEKAPPPEPWRKEGVPPENGTPGDQPPRGGLPGGLWPWVLAFLAVLAVNWIIASSLLAPAPTIEIPYTTFLDQVKADNVESVTSTSETITGKLKKAIADPTDPKITSTVIQTQRPTFAQDNLLQLLIDHKVVVNAKNPNPSAPVWLQILVGFGPTILLVLAFIWLMRRAGSSLGGLGGIGKAKAQLYQPTGKRTTFEDVAGIDDAEEELVEIVDFLRNPAKYTKLGGRIPKGVLLTGPPGTGKTLLARAVAGEAEVPFFSMSASEFIEMIVGVGASRVRDLFNQAKQVAPAIIFIDEIDAIGRARGAAMAVGGHDEREQTLNQILTEMDGFTGSEGVIVIAATNRPEILDPALLRPGRFDRQVPVSPPDQAGRKAILEVHCRDVPLADDVDLDAIASATPGMVGADLANLVNEAALMAARREHERVQQNDFTDALEKVILGTERRITMSDEEKERTAFHEAGHALLGMLQPGADPVRKISIIPRGRALGVTLQSPDADKYSYGYDYLVGKIIGMLGGRAAEEVVYGNVSTGAESDMVQATNLARNMVGRWGMSEKIGPVTIFDERSVDAFGRPQVSEETLHLVDEEVRRIIDQCYGSAVEQLKEHRSQLDALSSALLEHETLEESEAYEIAGVERSRPGT